jgi:hypothetical protein
VDTGAWCNYIKCADSYRLTGAGIWPGDRLASELRVKLGRIRPPIIDISITTAMHAWIYWESAAALDCTFLILLAGAVSQEIIAGKKWSNLNMDKK